MSQVARLLGLRTDALRRWVDGYERAGTTYAPVIREERSGSDTVTWGEFVEAGYLREYRARTADQSPPPEPDAPRRRLSFAATVHAGPISHRRPRTCSVSNSAAMSDRL